MHPIMDDEKGEEPFEPVEEEEEEEDSLDDLEFPGDELESEEE